MTTVRDYFEAAFPGHVYEAERDAEDLSSMPLNSPCGADCRKAIDAANALAEHVRAAFGQHRPQRIRAIADAAVDVCGCYICG